jgi:hypothetical protein
MVGWLTNPLWFSLLGCNSYQYIEWTICGVDMILVVCSFLFIFVEQLGRLLIRALISAAVLQQLT